MTASWPWLPTELYVHVLSFLPPARDAADVSAKTLASCLAANSHLRAAAHSPLLWEPHYRARYTSCVLENEERRKAAAKGDWHRMYVERRSLDHRALVILDEIRLQLGGRHQRARVFTRELSFDVWDALGIETQLSLPKCFRPEGEGGDTDDAPAPHALPRRYWARTVRGIIARRHALNLWGRITSGDESVTFEEAISGLSAFFDISPMQISANLDNLADFCRSTLVDAGVELNPESSQYDLRDLIMRIRHVLHSLGYSAVTEFYFPLNQFPHSFMSEGHRRTIPLSLVFVFVAIARRLGIQASPTNFPGRVLAYITSPDKAGGDMLFDLCGNTDPLTFTSRNVPQMLEEVGMMADAPPESVTPCKVSTTLYRAAANVLLSASRTADSSTETCVWANYAARCVFFLHAQAIFDFKSFLGSKPLDAVAVLADVLCPALTVELGDILMEHCADVEQIDERYARVRYTRTPRIKFFVGLVVRHELRDYVGCIVGWHPYAEDVDIWAGVSMIPQPDQPFYTILTQNGGKKYVAEEDICPATFTVEVARELFNSRTAFARYFEDIELGDRQRGRMLLSNELKTIYPDDDRAGEAWVSRGVMPRVESILSKPLP
ncbi:hypothetical protein BKA93DRAFT_186024 [Sparassis latifolia]